MNEFSTDSGKRQFSAAASLAALGLHLQQLQLFAPVRRLVKIGQKTVKHSPLDKLYDAWIAILAGAHGLVEVNSRLRSDQALQAAFGRTVCAEQSVVQETLDVCTTDNVSQLQQALDGIYRQHSQGYRHDYAQAWQILDADLTGMPCGAKAALATKGYFAKQRYRRGRQLGRVLASRYQEIVVDQLYPGTTYLRTALPELMLAAECTLQLDESKRRRTILRLDAGAGSVEDINWALGRGYQVHAKDYSGQRAHILAESVSEWVDDPQIPGRQVGWGQVAATMYVAPVRRLAVRCRKKNGHWGVGIIVSALAPQEVLLLTGQAPELQSDDHATLLAYLHFYDQRGGAVETAFKDDKQGLGITKRNKKRFAAQQMVMLLNGLAHNVLIWARRWLAPNDAKVAHCGVLRLVRDVFHISGCIQRDQHGQIVHVLLNQAAPLARDLACAFQALLQPAHIAVTLGET
jgi:hypothetical protein